MKFLKALFNRAGQLIIKIFSVKGLVFFAFFSAYLCTKSDTMAYISLVSAGLLIGGRALEKIKGVAPIMKGGEGE